MTPAFTPQPVTNFATNLNISEKPKNAKLEYMYALMQQN